MNCPGNGRKKRSPTPCGKLGDLKNDPRPLRGARWEYVSGGVILLGGIIGAATGSRLDRFASARLFDPIGASSVSWVTGLPDGLPHAGGGLFLRPRDAAKLGQLVIDEGRWQGRPIVDAG